MRAAAEQQLLPPSHFRPEVPPELDAVVMGLLERDVKKRTATGAEVRQQLLALTGEAAPYPSGQQALSQAAQEAMVRTRQGAERASGAHSLSEQSGALRARSG